MADNSKKIQPRTLKGFRDLLPELAIPREHMIDLARAAFRSFGFVPIETPVLEYLEILLGKGGAETDKQMYRFVDGGKREVGMRFDLTIPFARFAAQHIGQLGTPFKRYHIAPVWRAENTQRGRYREFVQCDFDTIGTESMSSDVETLLVIDSLLNKLGAAMGFTGFKVHLNNRKVLTGYLEKLGLQERSVPVLRALDKLDKIGEEGVTQELAKTAEMKAEDANEFLRLTKLRGDFSTVLDEVQQLVGDSEIGQVGVQELRTVLGGALDGGVDSEHFVLDLAIARGLDYYTGTIYETILDQLPAIGSVCSGGRYDNLAELYTKQRLPGVGASLGLDRLLAAMEELELLSGRGSTASVFVPFFAADRMGDYLALCQRLRAAGLDVEFYPEPKKLGAQLKYADKRGFPLAVVIGDDEWESGEAQVKVLASGEGHRVAIDSLAQFLLEL
ncbi:MAG: histidyl-tRNA synthetase [Planctomycetota bacterium]|jgi:histidyl-tRNA synthetase